ncbi:uncharacterized protein J3R85_019895 [Psidium guajava]|nr:uncharacterized protein J3R85_019895 [Psidium guajava]
MDKHEQYERVFSHFDGDKDGKISPAELRQCVATVGGGDISLEEAEAAMEVLDGDGNGQLGFEDFVAFIEGGGAEEKNADLKEAFKMYEMDGGGCITPKSLKKMLSRLGESRSLTSVRR